MTIQTGKFIPFFEARTRDGKLVNSHSFHDKVRWFIFYAGAPHTNLHLSALAYREPIIENVGLQVIAVFATPQEGFPKTISGKAYPKFPVISDPERKLFQAFGVDTVNSKGLLRKLRGPSIEPAPGPVHFLVAEDGLLEQVYVGRHPADHIHWETVDDFIESRENSRWQAGTN